MRYPLSTDRISQATEFPKSYRELLFYALLFLFPIGGFSVPHWLSTFFLLLALVSLVGPRIAWTRLEMMEKWVLFSCLGYFVAFVLSGLINDAEAATLKRLGVELRYLFIVPIYLVVKNLQNSVKWLLRGCAIGGWVYFINAGYEFFMLGNEVVAGGYHHILFGTTAAIYSVLLWNRWWTQAESGLWQRVYLSGAILAGLTVIMSGSRTAYVVLLSAVLLWAMIFFRRRSFAGALLVIVCAALASYAVSERVANRVDQAINEVDYYLKLDNPAQLENSLPSTALRLEMWRTSLLIIRDNPWIGVARGGYPAAAARYVDEGKVHWEVPVPGQPHNAYLEVLVSFGIIGFIPFLGMLILPAVMLWRGAMRSDGASAGVVLFLVCYATTSLAAGAPFLRGNAVALFVILLAVLLSDAVRNAAMNRLNLDAKD